MAPPAEKAGTDVWRACSFLTVNMSALRSRLKCLTFRRRDNTRRNEVDSRAGLEDGDPYKQSVQAKMWVGVAVAEVLDLDVEKKHEKAKIRAIVKQWLETDGPCVDGSTRKTGKEVPVISVGTWITGEEAGL